MPKSRNALMGSTAISDQEAGPRPAPLAAPVVDKMYRLHQVKEITGLSSSTIYDKMNPDSPRYDPEFPRPVRIGKRAVAWRESGLSWWSASRESTTA